MDDSTDKSGLCDYTGNNPSSRGKLPFTVWWTRLLPVEKVMFALVTANILFSTCKGFRFFYINFFSHYNTGEVLISYKGGFVRRGLLGEFFSLFAGMPFFRVFVVGLLFFIALTVAWFFLKWLLSIFESSLALLLFASPGSIAGLFYNNDIMRRDFITMAGILGMHWVIIKAWQYDWRMGKTLLLLAPIFCVCYLVHETIIFFLASPLLFLLLLYKGAYRKILLAVIFALAAIGGAYIALTFKGDPAAGVAWWKSIYPQMGKMLAMDDFLYWKYDNIPPLWEYFKYRIGVSMAVGIFLSFLPLMVCIYIVRPFSALKELTSRYKFYEICFLGSWLACVAAYARVMTDLGRELPMENFYALVILGALLKLSKNERLHERIKNKFSFANPILAVCATLFLFFWQIHVWVPTNSNSFLITQDWQRFLLRLN